MLKLINIFFIVIVIILIWFKLEEKKDWYQHNFIINNDDFNIKTNEGYIIIEKLNIKRLIVSDDYSFLDKGYVVLKKDENIVLAGHAIKNIFLNLHNIKINDEIVLFYNRRQEYLVFEKYIVKEDDYDFSVYSDKLILITCTKNNKERLIVVAKKKTI